MITTTKTDAALAQLMGRIAAGSYERCAACLRWAKGNKLAAAALPKLTFCKFAEG